MTTEYKGVFRIKWCICMIYSVRYRVKIETCFHVPSFLDTKMVELVQKSFSMEDMNTVILYSQNHGCWYPGDERSQCISSHGIGLILYEDTSRSTRRITFLSLWFSIFTQGTHIHTHTHTHTHICYQYYIAHTHMLPVLYCTHTHVTSAILHK